MRFLTLFLCLFGFPQLVAKDLNFAQLTIWNVGQGQWLTYNDETYCLHFDMGGENAPLFKIQKLCHKKKNILYLSHWDLDHISYIKNFSSRVFHFCLAGKPHRPKGLWKQKLLDLLKECSFPLPEQLVTELFSGTNFTANSVSRVFYLKPLEAIIPGDSGKREEAQWVERVPRSARGLILGHHGSKTSTGPEMLSRLLHLRWSVASARKKKYGHPHRQVIDNLKINRISLLKTQDWGNIQIQAPMNRKP